VVVAEWSFQDSDAVTNVETQPVLLGRVVGLFGLKGWIKVFSYTDPRESILKYDGLLLMQNGAWQKVTIAEGKKHGKSVIARLDGVEDPEQAGELIGCEIAVSRDHLPSPEVGSYYWRDLEGMNVVNSDGTDLGEVAYLMETGANDVLVTKGEQERLIPFIVDKVILDVDFAGGVITVDWEWD
jgi:16S rRNA processing protein RimM